MLSGGSQASEAQAAAPVDARHPHSEDHGFLKHAGGWTGDELKQFQVANLLGAHCTGIETVYRLRERAGLARKPAVVVAVGSTFVLEEGIHTGALAQ